MDSGAAMKKVKNSLEVLMIKKKHVQGPFTYLLMGEPGRQYIHVDNHVTKDKSMSFPLSAIEALLEK